MCSTVEQPRHSGLNHRHPLQTLSISQHLETLPEGIYPQFTVLLYGTKYVQRKAS